MIVGKNELPAKVIAIDENGSETTLFDGAKYGYDAVFWQEFPKAVNSRKVTDFLTINSDSTFELIVLVRYNLEIKTNFDTEFQQNGFVLNGRNEKLGKESHSNGYDSISIFAFGSDQQVYEILSEETA